MILWLYGGTFRTHTGIIRHWGLLENNQWDRLMLENIFFFFLGPHPWHMEVPRLGLKSELHLPAHTIATATATQDPRCICDLQHSSWQCRIPLTQCARPGIEPTSSWILVGFVTAEPWRNSWKIIFKMIMYVYMYMTESLCCTAEICTTLSNDYTLIFKSG